MTQRIAIYSDKNYIPPQAGGHVPMLIPFWGWQEEKQFRGTRRFDRYEAVGKDYFEMVDSIEEAQIVILPTNLPQYFRYESEHMAYEFADKAAQAQKPLIVFNQSDYYIPFEKDNALIFTPNLNLSRRRKNDFALPAWMPDYVWDDPTYRKKGEKPVVGFCGRVAIPTTQTRITEPVKRAMGRVPTKQFGNLTIKKWDANRHKFLRYDSMKYFENSPDVIANFIYRNAYFANAVEVKSNKWDEGKLSTVRDEYIENIFGSDYTLCSRGNGNYSYRFYETMSSARIPIFIDTDCILPFHEDVNWREQFFWIDVSELDQIIPRLVAYHDALSPEEFIDVQRNCRELWKTRLSPEGFFKNFYRHLELAGV